MQNTLEDSLVIKLLYQQEFRRFKVCKTCSWEDFLATLAAVLDLCQNEIKVKYEDNEHDLITVSTIGEFNDALAFAEEGGILKIHAFKMEVHISPLSVPAECKGRTRSSCIREDLTKLEELGFVDCKLNRYALKKFYRYQGCAMYNKHLEGSAVNTVADCLGSWAECSNRAVDQGNVCNNSKTEAKRHINRTLRMLSSSTSGEENEFCKDLVSQEKLKKLEELGFTDRWLNTRLLRRFASKGERDVSCVIAVLEKRKAKQAAKLDKRDRKRAMRLQKLDWKKEKKVFKQQKLQLKVQRIVERKERLSAQACKED